MINEKFVSDTSGCNIESTHENRRIMIVITSRIQFQDLDLDRESPVFEQAFSNRDCEEFYIVTDKVIGTMEWRLITR